MPIQPPQNAKPPQQAGLRDSTTSSHPSSVRLTLELKEATFESPKTPSVQAELLDHPRYVSHFIPLPPDRPSDFLGSRS